MQQSSATQSLHLSFWGLRKIVAYSHSSSQCLLVSTVFGTVSSLHPTSFLYLYIYTCYPFQMEVFFHISWRLSSSRAYCDQSLVNSGNLLRGEGSLVCQQGCSGTISSLEYRCTDFSAQDQEDWSFGERLFTYRFTGGPYFTIAFTGGDWIAPFNSGWSVTTTFSITKRNDTGRINSTPRAITSPVLRLQAGCNHTIRIPVTDPDNDIVRCRWAVGNECGGICGGFPGAILDPETCIITYSANQGQGYRAAAVMIEDYLPGSTDPMSSVGLQFLVLVVDTLRSCSVSPFFIPPTHTDGECIAIPAGTTFNTMLVAVSGYVGDTISEIQTVSPAGTRKSDLMFDVDFNTFYVNITWTPTTIQENDVHLFCFTAINSAGLSTNQMCLELLPGYTAPTPVPETALPNSRSVTVHPSGTKWHISFDRNISRPLTTAYITFHEFDTERIVHKINTSSDSEITFINGTVIEMMPVYNFAEVTKYYINFERGIVIGLDGCGPGNEPVINKEFWVFTTLDITPPVIHFLNNPPSVSNANISFLLESNEEVVWQCSLITGLIKLEEMCSNGSWNGANLQEGEYNIEVSGTDMANNIAIAVHAFTIDTTPPIVTFTIVPAMISNVKNNVFFQFTCEEICTYQCKFYEASDEIKMGFSCNSTRFHTGSLSHGKQYTFSVTATDQVGNVGEPVSYTWNTDFEVPTIFGVMNTSAICTTNLAPDQTGHAQAVDDGIFAIPVTFHDQKFACSVSRTWRAQDKAGNIGMLTQYITLHYQAALNFVPEISISCDSSIQLVSVPTSTATVDNPCGRPLRLIFDDRVSDYRCPSVFTRSWNLTDECNQESSTFEQIISLFDVCSIDACGRNESPPHGICVQGSCICSEPWYGENCGILIQSIQVSQVNDHILHELEDYNETLTLTRGTPPFVFTLIVSPPQMTISQATGSVTWFRSQAGNYTVIVEIKNQVSSERASWLLYVKPGYTAFLDPLSMNLFHKATPLELSGHVMYNDENRVHELLNGFVPVTVEINSRNGKRQLTVFSRQDGTFSVVFYPGSTEYGSYIAGAKHPRVPTATEQTSWDFLGMSATPRFLQLRGSTVTEYERTFHNVSRITNDGPRALNDITAAISFTGNDDLIITVILIGNSTLEPNENAYIDIEIRATGALEAIFPVTLESAEGVALFLNVNLKIVQILPQLSVEPSTINTRVVRGMLRSLHFNVSNVGIIAAHMVRAVLPRSDFLSVVSFGNALQQIEGNLTLASEESAQLSVLATIPPKQPLGDISGQIVISSIETFQTIQFNLIVSSNMLMNLTVAVEDEYTYFAEGQPPLSNAVVRIVNNIRGIQETLTTGEGGTVTFINIPEDRYELYVSGPNHVSLKQIIVTSAEEPLLTLFLARTAVTYSFTVVPTTVEETYTVTLEADFETHVPVPVVTITPRQLSLEPYELGLEDTIQYNITNHGLIRTDNVGLELPTSHPFLEFTTDIKHIGSLDALTSIIVPVKVTRVDGREKRNAPSCATVQFYAVTTEYSFVCGNLQIRFASAVLEGSAQFYTCGGGGLGGGGRGGGGGCGYIVFFPPHDAIARPSIHDTSYSTPTRINCEKCLYSALGCLPNPIPFFSCLSLVKSVLTSTFNFRDIVDHSGWISCVHQIKEEIRPSRILRRVPGLGALLCLPGVLRDCFGVQTTLGRRRRSLTSTVRDTVQSYYAMHQFTLLGVEVLGDERWLTIVEDPTWLKETLQPVLSDVSDGGPLITNVEFNYIINRPLPRNATHEMVEALLERFNNTYVGWNIGTLEPENGFNMVSYSAAKNFTDDVREFNQRIVMSGYLPFLESYNGVVEQYNMIDNFDEEGVCAVVRIRINQEIALTRDAFLAKLEIENMEMADLQQVQIDFLITNVNSAVDSTLLFSIGNETLTGSLKQGVDGWILASGMSGAAEWLIVPFSEAAPTETQDYNIGGTFSYVTDDGNISVPLLPSRVTVVPDPSLIMHYFWEKYVIGDNPFTDEREPSVPFVLGLAIHNAGYGPAMNLHITSGQPEIIDNDKGLLVTFKIIGTRIGSESVTPSLAVNFGDFPAMTTKVARWLMISSLQGEFMNYSASFEYTNPLGDPRLSVLDELVIHDLIRNVHIYQDGEDDGILDFLVNDRQDLFSIPDALYSSKTFTRYNVSNGVVESVNSQGSELVQVHAVTNYTGWVYFRSEVSQNMFSEAKIAINFTKSADGQTISLPSENAWITKDSQQNVGDSRPFILHIIDFIEEATEVTYILKPCTSDCVTGEQPFERDTPPGKIKKQNL